MNCEYESSPTWERLLKLENKWRPYGNLRSFCNGHIIISPIRPWWWVLQFSMIVITFTFIYEHEKYTLGTLISGLILSFTSLLACFRTTMTNPGVIKKPSFQEALADTKYMLTHGKPGSPESRTKNVRENGRDVLYCYCTMCYAFRPSYAKSCHCSSCGCCMDHWDHHCPVVGVCVSDTNCFEFNAMSLTVPSMWLFYFWVSLYNVLNGHKQKTSTVSDSLTFLAVLTGLLATLIVCTAVAMCDSGSKKPNPSMGRNDNIYSNSI